MSFHHALWSAERRWSAFAVGLALRDRPLRESFVDEYVSTLWPVLDQTLDELPPITQARLRAIMNKLASSDGDVAASVDALSEGELKAIVSDLLDIARAVTAMVATAELETS